VSSKLLGITADSLPATCRTRKMKTLWCPIFMCLRILQIKRA
jgi:hypothetical protein